ncbi:helix-turn-helix domain-containing protein [Bradyrhizobium sp. USDA 4502]
MQTKAKVALQYGTLHSSVQPQWSASLADLGASFDDGTFDPVAPKASIAIVLGNSSVGGAACVDAASSPSRSRRPLDGRRLGRVLDYIEQHLTEDIAVADLAGVACLSIFYFSRAFSAATGMPPHRYLTQRRLNRAKQMIEAGSASIAETAFIYRFSSQSSFTRAFRRATGTTPAMYRRVRDSQASIPSLASTEDRASEV